jgi:hypothetical protein
MLNKRLLSMSLAVCVSAPNPIVGFTEIGYKGLETNHREIVSHVVAQNGIYFVFQSALNPGNKLMADYAKYTQFI